MIFLVLNTRVLRIYTITNSQCFLSLFFKGIYSALSYLFTPCSSNPALIIDEHCDGMIRNQVYEAAQVYLLTKMCPFNQHPLRVSKTPRQKNIRIGFEKAKKSLIPLMALS